LAAAVLPAFAYAESAPGAQLLGGADALANFCSQVDPTKARQFEPQILGLLGIAKAPEDILEAARRDPLYRQAYEVFDAVFKQQALPDAKRACASLFARTVPPPTPRPPEKERHEPRRQTPAAPPLR
jgi:hypothetical protein